MVEFSSAIVVQNFNDLITNISAFRKISLISSYSSSDAGTGGCFPDFGSSVVLFGSPSGLKLKISPNCKTQISPNYVLTEDLYPSPCNSTIVVFIQISHGATYGIWTRTFELQRCRSSSVSFSFLLANLFNRDKNCLLFWFDRSK